MSRQSCAASVHTLCKDAAGMWNETQQKPYVGTANIKLCRIKETRIPWCHAASVASQLHCAMQFQPRFRKAATRPYRNLPKIGQICVIWNLDDFSASCDLTAGPTRSTDGKSLPGSPRITYHSWGCHAATTMSQQFHLLLVTLQEFASKPGGLQLGSPVGKKLPRTQTLNFYRLNMSPWE